MHLLQNFQDLGQDALKKNKKKKKKGSFQDCPFAFSILFPVCFFFASWKEPLLACTNMRKALRRWMSSVYPSLHLSLAKVQFDPEQRFDRAVRNMYQ